MPALVSAVSSVHEDHHEWADGEETERENIGSTGFPCKSQDDYSDNDSSDNDPVHCFHTRALNIRRALIQHA